MNGTILANRSAVDRNKTDFYETPPEVTVALLDFLEKNNLISPGCLIWEPAYGGGKMGRVMLDRGYAVLGTEPSYVLPLTWRPDFLYGAKSGRPTMELLWTVDCVGRDARCYILSSGETGGA